jgi:hypothetical protein
MASRESIQVALGPKEPDKLQPRTAKGGEGA